ncbi:MAG: M20/M25/M40 family metallo-hydrolase, partial [Candidatus Cloacimonetes bacterium]|nr:M20/M25/M40 family metallo-hydrolase [Candidatus Cloacimonadota bacterium]
MKKIILILFLLTPILLLSQMIVKIDKGDETTMQQLEELNLSLCFEMDKFIVVEIDSPETLKSKSISYEILTDNLVDEPLYIISKGKRFIDEVEPVIGEIVLYEKAFWIEKITTQHVIDDETMMMKQLLDGFKILPLKVSNRLFYRYNKIDLSSSIQQDSLHDSWRQDIISQVNADSLAWFVQKLEDFVSRHPINSNRFEIAEWIANQFIRFGYTNVVQDEWLADVGWFGHHLQRNVIATLEGTTNPDSYVIIGAHYDSISQQTVLIPELPAPGANDNASGTAAVLEMARIIKLNGGQPNYTIRFVAFAIEELGLWGSNYDAHKMVEQDKNVVAMINLDMIAYNTTEEWKYQIVNYPNSDFLTNLALEKGNEFGMNFRTDDQLMAASDSYSYYNIGGFPSIFFFYDEYSDDPTYHTVNDLLI